MIFFKHTCRRLHFGIFCNGDLFEKILAWEDEVQSVDVHSFDKI